MTGDFNCLPGSLPYRSFAGDGFEDTFRAAGNRDGRGADTFHAFGGLRYFLLRCGDGVRHGGRRARRIDWILLKDGRRRLRTEAHEILRDRDEQSFVYPSDHYPLLAMFARPADTRPSGGALRCGPAGQPPAGGPRRRPRCRVEIYPVG